VDPFAMESSQQVSWQFENFSSAEFSLSPPFSPSSPQSPQSPSLYNGTNTTANNNAQSAFAKNGVVVDGGILLQNQSASSARAQLASNILNDLEQQQGSLKMDMNDFGMNWNEQSVDLNLFEELAEIEYTPPASPLKRPNKNNNSVKIPVVSSNLDMINHLHNLSGHVSESSPDISALTAEFQAILDSLPKDNANNTVAISQVLEIAGIPTTIIDGEALVPVEFVDFTGMVPAHHQHLSNFDDMDMEIENDVNLNEINDNDSDIIEESELYDINSNVGSPASSTYSNSHYGMITNITTTTANVVDEHSEAAQKILDALLVGDVATAEYHLPDIVDISDDDDEEDQDYDCDDDDQSSVSSEDSFKYALQSASSRAAAAVVATEKKPERRGRKPGKKLGSTIKDKGLRKKEQNKTAATRYRQKKKMEFSLILETEAELEQEHDDLEKKKDNLSREILMVKQLLRDVLQSKKPAVNSLNKAKSIVLGRGLSNLVVRNRRK
jgi:hypothetical protein